MFLVVQKMCGIPPLAVVRTQSDNAEFNTDLAQRNKFHHFLE
jgi:hypothetical protein